MTSEQILDSSPIFARVRGSSRDRLLRMAQIRTFAKGQRVVDEGQACPGVFIVGEGLFRIYKLSPNGKEHVLHLAGGRETVLEVASILGMDCPAFIEAIEDTQCVLLPDAAFRQALQEDHQLCIQLLAGMAMRVRHFVGLLENVVLRDALSRVARHLLTLWEQQGETVNLPGLKKHMASHLNLTSETLSRCLRQLDEGGLIENEAGGGIRIMDRDGLQDVADGMYPKL